MLKVAALIKDKYLIDCQLGSVTSTTLLDTGAQVFIVGEKYLKNELCDHQLKKISVTLEKQDSLRVQWEIM